MTSIGWHVWTFLDEMLFESESEKENNSCWLSERRSSFCSSPLTGPARDIQSTKWSFHYLLNKLVSPFVKCFVGHLLRWKNMSIGSKFVRGRSMEQRRGKQLCIKKQTRKTFGIYLFSVVLVIVTRTKSHKRVRPCRSIAGSMLRSLTQLFHK